MSLFSFTLVALFLLAACSLVGANSAEPWKVDKIVSSVGFGFQSSGSFDSPDDFYTFRTKALDGSEVSFERFRNKVVMITNVASACGYTSSNYEQLIELQNHFSAADLVVVLVPSNDFGLQEPGSSSDIQRFVSSQGNGVEHFVMLEKSAMNGEHQSDLVEWLKRVTKSEKRDITWNFETKFIISPDGKTVARYSQSFSPLKLKPTIEYFLRQKSLVKRE